MTSKSPSQPCTNSLARRCRSSSYAEFFAESPGAADEPLTDDSDTEDRYTDDSYTDESENSEDRDFVVHDEFGESGEEYFPHESLSEDCWSSASSESDVQYALSDDSDSECSLGDMHFGISSDIDVASAAKEKPTHAIRLDDKLLGPSQDDLAASRTPSKPLK